MDIDRGLRVRAARQSLSSQDDPIDLRIMLDEVTVTPPADP
jgi:hypothetical protein